MESGASSGVLGPNQPGRFVQAAPSKLEEETKAGAEAISSTTVSGVLSEELLPEEADDLLLWLTRYPVERNHPRSTTDTIPLNKSGEVVTMRFDEKIPDVLRKLITEGFSSAPVIDGQGNYTGSIDLLDICWHVLTAFGIWRGEQGFTGEAQRKEQFATFMQLDQFRNKIVGEIVGLATTIMKKRHYAVYKGFSTFSVMETLARVNEHRAIILDSSDKITGILTQSMMISLFDQNLDRFGGIKSLPVADMVPLLRSELICVNERELTANAFRIMVEKKVNGIGVTNEAGHLVDTLAVRDIRVIGPAGELFSRMWLSVAEFKRIAREEFPLQTPNRPIFVTQDNNFEAVIRAMDDGNIHRVFVCQRGEQGREQLVPIHCISQGDVLRYVMWKCGLTPVQVLH